MRIVISAASIRHIGNVLGVSGVKGGDASRAERTVRRVAIHPTRREQASVDRVGDAVGCLELGLVRPRGGPGQCI